LLGVAPTRNPAQSAQDQATKAAADDLKTWQ
jgi:hypothetical protein